MVGLNGAVRVAHRRRIYEAKGNRASSAKLVAAADSGGEVGFDGLMWDFCFLLLIYINRFSILRKAEYW